MADRDLHRPADIQVFYYQPRQSVGNLARLNEAVLTQQVLKDAHIRQLRLGPMEALGIHEALLQDCLVTVRIHPEDVYVCPAHHVKVLLKSIRVVVFSQACRHENDAALPCAFSKLLENGRPDLASQLVMFIASVGYDCYNGVDKQMVVQKAGRVGGQELFGSLENGELGRTREAIQDDYPAGGHRRLGEGKISHVGC